MLQCRIFWNRSVTVIHTLQRLRHSSDRFRHPSGTDECKSSGDKAADRSLRSHLLTSSTSSVPASQVEALKLLDKKIREKEALTNVLPTSPTYCIEVGKMLAMAAYFGASTSTVRVAEALTWIEISGPQQLTTLRQIMSIATPLANLSDGPTAGKKFFFRVMLDPLEKALDAVNCKDTAAGTFDEQLHTKAAILSMFHVIHKFSLTVSDSESHDANRPLNDAELLSLDALKKAVKVLRKCTTALVKEKGSERKADLILELDVCVSALMALHSLEVIATGHCDMESGEEIKKLTEEWMGLLKSSAATNVSQHAAKISQAILQLAQLALVVSKMERGATLLGLFLDLVPSSISSSSTKDICALSQVVNRLCQKYGEVVTPEAVKKMVEALRPKIVQLSESNQFRHVESSILMANLSRWEEVIDDPDSFVLSNDLLEVLCSRFAAYINMVQMSHLTPFLQGLSRANTAREARHGERGLNNSTLLRSSHVETYLNQCMQRAQRLVKENNCKAFEAASCLRVFVELGLNAEPYFLSVQQLLRSAGSLSEISHAGAAPSKPCGGLSLSPSYSFVIKSVEYFIRSSPKTNEQEKTLLIAKEVLKDLYTRSPEHILRASQPSELIGLFSTLVGDPIKQWEDSTAESIVDLEIPEDRKEAIRAFLNRVVELAPQCNLTELSSLSLAVSQVSVHAPESSPAMRIILKELHRCEALGTSVQSWKKVMDAVCRMPLSASDAIFVSEQFCSAISQVELIPAMPQEKLQSLVRLYAQCSRSVFQFLSHVTLPINCVATMCRVLIEGVLALVTNAAKRFIPGERYSILCSELIYLSFQLSRLQKFIRQNEAEEEINEELGEDEGLPGDLLSVPKESDAQIKSLLKLMQKTLKKVGDIVESSLHDESDLTEMNKVRLEPRRIVMLIQALENSSVKHPRVFYALLHELCRVAHLLDPLELSLVMNASLRQGVWNARVMQLLAAQVEKKAQQSPLRQCQMILSALQKSRFLSPQTFLSGTLPAQPASSVVEKTSPLEILANAMIRRMHLLSDTRSNVKKLLHEETLEVIVGSVRALAYFSSPPQPAFDTYFMIAAKMLVGIGLRSGQAKKEGKEFLRSKERWVGLAALHLLACASKTSNVLRQRRASVTIQRSLMLIEECAQQMHSAEPSSTLWASLTPKELGGLIVQLQLHHLFYSPQKSKRSHRKRVKKLLLRLIQAYLTKVVPLRGPPLQRSLEPLFSPGNLICLPPKILDDEFIPFVQKVLAEKWESEKMLMLLGRGLQYRLSIPLTTKPEEERITLLSELIRQIINAFAGKAQYQPHEATFLIGCFGCIRLLPDARLMNQFTDALLPASFEVSRAVELVLGLSLLKVAPSCWDPGLEAIAIRVMQMLHPLFSGQSSTCDRRLAQIFHLLTSHDGVFLRAFLQIDEKRVVGLHRIALELLLQALSVVFKAFYLRSSALSLTPNQLRVVNRRVLSYFSEVKDIRQLDRIHQQIYDLCSKTLV